jgi:arabinogalactan oligomer/maltooligosaccharide transport system substrate-binding protein
VPHDKLPVVRDVVAFLTSAEMQFAMALELATVPVLDSLRHSPELLQNEDLQASIRQIELSRPMPLEPEMRQIWDGMRGPYQLVMNGAVTPEEGARLMQQEVEKRIADTFL